MISFNPACYLPSSASKILPSAIACPPPPSPIYTIYDTLTSPFTSTFTVLKSSMDAIMSLPFLSFLLIPTMTSYSTSLNLLFFYLTWSTLVLSHAPLRVEIVACIAVKILFYVLPSLLFLTFDILVPTLSEGFKSLGSSALPLKNLSRKNTLRQGKILAWSLGNMLLGIAAQALVEYSLVEIWGKKSALKVTTTLPLPWAILKDLLRGFLVRDLLTFIIHRFLMHSEQSRQGLFSAMTQLHTSWYHNSITSPFPLSPTYDHPVSYLLRCFVPTYFPAYFWRFHLLTYIVYLILISLEETFTHSGYASLPTNFILGGIARRNEMHCLSNGEGNFGTWGLADWVWGTNVGGDAAEELMDEVEEANVQEKVARQVQKGVKGLRRSKRNSGGTASVTSGAESGYGTELVNGSSSPVVDGIEELTTKKVKGRRKSTRRSRRRKHDDDDDYYE